VQVVLAEVQYCCGKAGKGWKKHVYNNHMLDVPPISTLFQPVPRLRGRDPFEVGARALPLHMHQIDACP